MRTSNFDTRRLTGLIVAAFTVAALVVPAASAVVNESGAAQPQTEKFVPGVTDFPSRLGVSANPSATVPQDEAFTPAVTDFPSSLGESGEAAANTRLSQLSPQGLPVDIQTQEIESGFDWSAAASGAIAASLLLLGAALAVRMARRSRVAVA
jgi:hypothetical protein